MAEIRKIKKQAAKEMKKQPTHKSEEAMIAGIIEGSPDAVGVAVVRLSCGCRKMAGVDRTGEPASKVVIYRDGAESVCAQCKEDQGSFSRLSEQFIHWSDPEIDEDTKAAIILKALGTGPHKGG